MGIRRKLRGPLASLGEVPVVAPGAVPRLLYYTELLVDKFDLRLLGRVSPVMVGVTLFAS